MWALYWIDILSNLPGNILRGLFFGAIAAVVILIAHGIYNTDSSYESRIPADTIKRRMLWLPLLLVVLPALLLSFVPSKQTMHLMLGVKATDTIVNSETGQKVQKIINEKLEEYLKTFTEGEKK